MQKIIGLIKKPDTTKISCLLTPWREIFKCLSLYANNFIYMDERLLNPKALRPNAGNNFKCLVVSTPQESCPIAREWPQCEKSGNNVKQLLRQKQIRKLPRSRVKNHELAKKFRRALPKGNKSLKISSCITLLLLMLA